MRKKIFSKRIHKKLFKLNTETNQIMAKLLKNNLDMEKVIYWCGKYPKLFPIIKKDIILILKKISSLEKLIFYWQSTLNQDIKKIVARRITELIKKGVPLDAQQIKTINHILN